MSNEVYNFALKSTLQEIQNACPDIISSFIFKDRKLIAKDNITKEETANQTIVAFNKAAENAAAIGGLKSLTVQSIKGKAKIIAINVLTQINFVKTSGVTVFFLGNLNIFLSFIPLQGLTLTLLFL